MAPGGAPAIWLLQAMPVTAPMRTSFAVQSLLYRSSCTAPPLTSPKHSLSALLVRGQGLSHVQYADSVLFALSFLCLGQRVKTCCCPSTLSPLLPLLVVVAMLLLLLPHTPSHCCCCCCRLWFLLFLLWWCCCNRTSGVKQAPSCAQPGTCNGRGAAAAPTPRSLLLLLLPNTRSLLLLLLLPSTPSLLLLLLVVVMLTLLLLL